MDKTSLLSQANKIRNATELHENSAERVGKLLVDIIESIGDVAALAQLVDRFSVRLEALTGYFTPVDDLENPVPFADAVALRANRGLFSHHYISTKGMSDGGSGGGMDEELLAGYLKEHGYVTAAELPSLSGYATEQWVLGKGYLTAAALDGYATRDWVTGRGYALDSALKAHVADTTVHVTAAERLRWDTAANSLDSILGADSDTIINKWDEVVAFLDTYTEADTLANLLSNKVDKRDGYGLSKNDFTDTLLQKLNGIEAGANKFILRPAKAAVLGAVMIGASLSVSAEGLLDLPVLHAAAGTHCKVDYDRYGRVTGGSALAEGDIPALSISKITGLQTALDKKLDKAVFDDLFEKVKQDNGTWAIRAKYGLFSNEFIATRGTSDDSGAGGGGIDVTFLEDYLAGKNYATESWVSGQLGDFYTKGQSDNRFQPKGNYLTQHQSLDSCAAVGNWQGDLDVKSGIYRIVDIGDKDKLPHKNVGSSILHFKWDVNASQQLMMDYADERVYARFERGNVTGNWNKLAYISDIPTSMAWGSITGKPTTLAEYGITDAYTKSEADSRYVNADGDDMTGVLTITTDTSGVLNLKTETANAAPFMRFWQVGDPKTSVGWDRSNGSYIFNYASQKQLGIKDDGTPHFNGNKLWHSGNDGSGSGLDADLLDGYHESAYFRNNIAVIASGDVMKKLPGNRSGSYQVSRDGWYGSATVFYTGGSNSGLAFYRPGGSNSIPRILVATDSTSNWVDKGVILTSAQIANDTDIAAFTADGFYWTGTDSDSATLKNSPFSTSFAMITQTCYNSGTDLRRSRVAWDGYGAMKIFDDRSVAGTPGTWYDVLTGKNYISILDKRYVTKKDLAEMFTIVTEGGKKSIKAMMGLWSADWIATKGQSDSSGTSGAGIDVTFLESYLKGDNADKAVYATQSWVGSSIDSKLASYATQSWVNSQGFLKSHQSLANYVTLDSWQIIRGQKQFIAETIFTGAGITYADPAPSIACAIKASAPIAATSFIRKGGTAAQALMADGSVTTKVTATAVSPVGWTGNAVDDVRIPTMSFMAHWNGAYTGIASNLRYCDRGRFGDIVTHSHSEYVTALGANGNYLTWTKNGAVNNITVPYATNADTLDGEHGTSYFKRQGRLGSYNIDTLTEFASRDIQPSSEETIEGTKPFNNWGTLLSFKSMTDKGGIQIAGGGGSLFFRQAYNANFSGAWKTILHSDNYATILNALYYTESEVNSLLAAKVSKAGDTMTGNLLFSNSGTALRGIQGTMGDNDQWRVMGGATGSNAGYLEIATSDDGNEPIYVRQYNAGVFGSLVRSATLLDGSGNTAFPGRVNASYFTANSTTLCTNLNADLLDGYHKESFESRYVTVIDARNLDENTWYPVVMPLGNSEQTRIRIEGNTLAPATWNGRGDKAMSVIVDYTVNGSMWGWTSTQRVFHHVQFGAGANDSVVCGAGQLEYNSAEYIFVRGGAQYRFVTSRWITPTLYTSTYTGAGGQAIAPTTTRPAAIARTNAWLTDNVASATKLQSARSIWGQSFNGTANVSGNMTGVGSIRSSLGITKNPADVNSPVHSTAYWYGLSFGDNDTNIVRLGGYYGLHLFTASGTLMMGTSGNVGIGTTAPAYKLDVNGSTIVRGWFRTTGDTGWLNDTHQGGWYMSDDTWIRSYNNKSLYLYTGTIRTDGQIQVGGNGSKFLVDSSGNVTTIGKLTLNLSGENIVSGFYKLNSTSNNPYLNLKIGSLDYYVQAYNSKLCMGPSASKGISVDHVGDVQMSGNARIFGNLLLKSDDSYGNRLSFGDGDYVYLSETEDDELYIYANNGIYLGSDDYYISIAKNSGLMFTGAGLLSADTAVEAIRCSCGFYSDKFIATKGTADLSDMRLKRVLESMELKVEDIAAAPLFIHEWRNEPGSRALGSSAQYWEGYVPEAVHWLGNYRTMEYDKLGVAMGVSLSRRLLNVESRHSRWLEKHETRVQRLERRVRELEKELETLKQNNHAA
ncbi:MAG: shufflon system plasmid conjugative transfer pilus tip adhesin PilV [Bacteroides sp.]|nr:shufflon system plasmid conjugative transfer pilus tip adhesin PilV [Bacteroides sp.]MCM1391041.1 shufflon system plasmid conjugative transfer pilus tip adhesin PilV [Bacteroides sp.]